MPLGPGPYPPPAGPSRDAEFFEPSEPPRPELSWIPGWWLPPCVLLGSAMIGGVIWWVL